MNAVTADELARLRAVAEDATPGPWSWVQYLSGTTNVIFPGEGNDGTFLYLTRRSDGSEPKKANDAAHIAAFDPPTALRLLDMADCIARVTALLDVSTVGHSAEWLRQQLRTALIDPATSAAIDADKRLELREEVAAG